MALTGQTRGNDLCIVQDQSIARAQDLWKIKNMTVRNRRSLRQKQLRRGARTDRSHRDPGVWKVKIELGQFHWLTCGGLRRKMSRNMPGVNAERGFTLTCGAAAEPPNVKLKPINPSPRRVKMAPMPFTK